MFKQICLKDHILRIEYLFISAFVFFLVLSSCRKETNSYAPEITIIDDSAAVHSDTSITMGGNMRFVIKAHSYDAPLTNLVVKQNGAVYLDSGLYANEMNYILDVTKGPDQKETWTFFVMNSERNSDSVTVIVELADSSQFLPVIFIDDLRLGAQLNIQYGSFYSFTDDSVYFLQDACARQEFIDIIYYHDIYGCTLSSPNEADAPAVFSGSCGLAGWSVKNESRYFLTNLTLQEFINVSNDSVIIASYDPVNAKRKGKYAAPGNVWSFRLNNGKLGLIYIKETTAGNSGNILMSIKVQQ